MVKTCLIENCSTSTKNNPFNVVMHELPSNPEKRKIWLSAIESVKKTRRRDCKGDAYGNICGLHFSVDAYFPESKRLRIGAVPSVFKAPAVLVHRVPPSENEVNPKKQRNGKKSRKYI